MKLYNNVFNNLMKPMQPLKLTLMVELNMTTPGTIASEKTFGERPCQQLSAYKSFTRFGPFYSKPLDLFPSRCI